MSESQKSPSAGLSEASAPSVHTRAVGGVTAAGAMEIGGPDLSRMAPNKPPGDKDGKLNFPYAYQTPAGLAGMMPPAYALQSAYQQQLLAAHILNFYNMQARAKSEEATKAVWEVAEQQQKLREMEDQRVENDKLIKIKHKPPEEGTAVASDAVKNRLRTSLIRKRLQKNNQQHASSIEIGRSAAYNSWGRSHSTQSPPPSMPSSAMSPPYKGAGSSAFPGARDIDYPLRKTLSEPNLKNKTNPRVRRHAGLNSPLTSRRKPLYGSALTEYSANGTSSNPASPPLLQHGIGSTPAISMELKATKRPFEEAQPARTSQLSGSENLNMSMPNISLSKSLNTPSSRGLLAESDRQSAARYGLPLTNHHLMPSPFHPREPGISEEDYFHSQTGFAPVHDARRLAHPYRNKTVSIQDPQASQRHIRHTKPLSRTQSAPLPLLHPAALMGGLGMLAPQQQTFLEHQQLVKQHQDQIFKEQQKKKFVVTQLRQTLLQRSSSKSKMEHVDEETEARLIQEMQESREDNYESQSLNTAEKLHSSHGSLYAAVNAANNSAGDHGLLHGTDKLRASHLSRTHSSPLVFAMPNTGNSLETPINLATKAGTIESHPDSTGVTYDEAMLKHHCPCRDNAVHLENPTRIQSIWNRLQSSGVVAKCRKIDAKKATIEQLQLCHSESYSLFFGVNSLNRKKLDLAEQFQRLDCGGVGVDTDTVWNEDHSAHAARIATGSVIELASRVYERQLKNGMAVVRPPGHHAESGQAMGFCFFNSIAIAAKHLKHRLGASKILILDWDVHHGNGTQQMTYDDPCILYVSLHRHDNGNFFPGTGDLADCGEKQGLGFNVNVAFSGGLDPPMGDAEYMAAFRSIVMPIVNEFKPQITLVSAGFDGADGHAAQLGGYKLSTACFGYMTKQLMGACDGRLVLVLEGGYNLPAICDASEMCMRALLGDRNVPLPNQEEIMKKPNEAAIRILTDCANIQSQFWPMVKNHTSKINISFVDSLRVEKEESEAVTAMASLSMVNQGKKNLSTTSSTESEPMEEL